MFFISYDYIFIISFIRSLNDFKEFNPKGGKFIRGNNKSNNKSNKSKSAQRPGKSARMQQRKSKGKSS